MSDQFSIDIVIPSYQRGEILVQTIKLLSQQKESYSSLLIIDQTDYSDDSELSEQLNELHQQGIINWLRIDEPSIPNAMNQGLLASSAEYVLFLDDDIEPAEDLLAQHKSAIQQLIEDGKPCIACVGQILQPNEVPTPSNNDAYGKGFDEDLVFPFNSTKRRKIKNCMAGNLLVNREKAIDCGGFDTHFYGVAYRFETEFCRRFIGHTNGEFYFVPEASLKHLKLARGGTRSKVSNFLTSAQPDHSVGEYYFIFRHSPGLKKWYFSLRRLFGSLKAKFYLKQPWWLPVRLVGEVRGLIKGFQLAKLPAQLIRNS